MQKPYLPVRAIKIPRMKGDGIGPKTESCVNCDGPIVMVPCLHQGNIYTKRKLWYGESRYAYSKSVQYPQLPVRAVKIPRLEGGGIGPRMESCVICDGPIAMFPCLHQGNIYNKRKLRVWREQICTQQFGAIHSLTCAGR